MGASEWACIVPYQPDFSAAMIEAQRQEYMETYDGRVSRESAIAQLRSDMDYFLSQDPSESTRQYFERRIHDLESLREPTTLEEAIQLVRAIEAEEGTGSILDMEGISDQPDYFMITPLTDAELFALFGMPQPDHDMVMAAMHQITGYRASAQGTCLVIYRDGQPDEIFFGGFSGD